MLVYLMNGIYVRAADINSVVASPREGERSPRILVYMRGSADPAFGFKQSAFTGAKRRAELIVRDVNAALGAERFGPGRGGEPLALGGGCGPCSSS